MQGPRGALAFALALVAAESLAAFASGVTELGLYAAQGFLLFAAAWGVFALPLPRRWLALATLAAVGLFHAVFAGYDVDRRLGWIEGLALALLALGLAVFFARATRAGGTGEFGERGVLALFASGYLVQALWCARLLFPLTDAGAGWVAGMTVSCALAAPALALLAARRILRTRRSPAAWLALALLLLAPWLLARPVFWRAHRPLLPAEAQSAATRPDVLLVVLDTVRADRMSLYGHGRPTTPALERFARHATVYDAAQSQAVWTLPGHASLFTGLYPSEHQAEWKDGVAWLRKLKPEAMTLAERFGLGGYRTACLAANAFLGSELGLSQGFEWLVTGRSSSVYLLAPATVMALASAWGGPGARQRIGPFERGSTLHATEINRLALEWLERTAGGPRFLVLNYMEAHDPLRRRPCAAPRFGDGRSFVPDNAPETDAVWAGRATVAPESARRLADWYDGALACLDLHLGEFFDALEARALLDGMLVVVTADHGHLLGEHDAFDHEAEVWRELTHVPLVLKLPGQRTGARCAQPVETASLAFVLPWLAGLAEELVGFQTNDAARLPPRGPAPEAPPCPLVPALRPAVSEAPERYDLAQENPRFATRWTAFVDGPLKFFVDGEERVRVAERGGPEILREPTPDELERARALLSVWRAGLLAPAEESALDDEEAAERLRLLQHQGYAGG